MAASAITAPLMAQQVDAQRLDVQMEKARKALEEMPNWQGQLDQAGRLLKDFRLDDPQLKFSLDEAGAELSRARGLLDELGSGLSFKLDSALAAVGTTLAPGFAFAPQQSSVERAREAAERAQEAQERAREAVDRIRETEDRNNEWYRDGYSLIDDHRYEKAIDRFDRVIGAKWPRADGAYYWKAYALNKLGKSDEALAALAEIPKQFPQSRWINDANALRVEIQQAKGQNVSPESQSDEDMRLLAINALMNSEPERAIPLLEKVINDPKNPLSIKGKALFVLAQSRSEKGHQIVAQYAKNGSNPDLQLRAVSYIGTYRSKDSQQILADVYASVSDPAVKRAVLRSMMVSRDTPHLFAAAKSESNADLRRDAIRQLGNLQAVNELSQLYASETNTELKGIIIDAIFVGRGTDKLIELAKGEKDATLRLSAIRRLGTMGRDERIPDALVAMYRSESDKTVKIQIAQALWHAQACKQLVDINRAEKDVELKTEGVRRLGQMKGCKEATDYLMEIINK